MRELILLRHAHAEPPAAGQSDLDRPLSAEGNAEAEAAGRWLREQRLVPDLALCSPSRRTRETLESVLGQVGYVDQRLEDDIYEASPGALATLVDRPPEVERLPVVGHHPRLERPVALHPTGPTGAYHSMPPGGT